jgi:type III pantothenate kinase
MHLVFDIGNSNVVCGLYQGPICQHIWRWETIKNEESRMYYQKRIVNALLEEKVDLLNIKSVTMSSVVPVMDSAFLEMLSALFKAEIHKVQFDSYPELTIHTDSPDEMGTDLIANAVAALEEENMDTIIVDFGTALTFTVVQKDYHIQGVAIAPGIFTALRTLHGSTAQLPEVQAYLPSSAIGKNTVNAIQAGVFRGYIGLVKEIIESIELEKGRRFKRIATGGLSGVLTPLEKEFDLVKKDLTLNGIRLIGEMM